MTDWIAVFHLFRLEKVTFKHIKEVHLESVWLTASSTLLLRVAWLQSTIDLLVCSFAFLGKQIERMAELFQNHLVFPLLLCLRHLILYSVDVDEYE